MKTALLVHGAFGDPEENWLPWLKQELEKFDYKVIIPTLPTPEEQNLESWMKIAEPYLAELDEESVIVGHSIGATFLLSVLEKLEKPIYAAVFVSGFLNDLGDEQFDSINRTFYQKEFDWDRIKRNAEKVAIFHGSDDPYVPTAQALALARRLETEPIIIPNGGHLNEAAGFTEFPELLEEVVTFDNRKALLVPVNSKRQILIQDRRGFKKPDWGYFGGEIEKGETPLEAVLRESKEELGIDIKPEKLIHIGISSTKWSGKNIIRYMYVYPTDQEKFEDFEGKGAYWLTFGETRERMEDPDRFDEVARRIKKVVSK